ncbi:MULTISPECIES: restriction endonuclease subunit S [unclassified Glutamicibacter]|uniref:restriction endonuclease subunit S n=1 Tax=Glutamicibacter TaxID=1742989 RepID=UPI0038063C83
MTRIADVVELTFGFAFKSAEFADGPDDVRLLRGDNVAQGNLKWAGAKRFPLDRVNEVDRYLLSPGDVVIAMDRPWIGAGLKYAVVRKHDLPSLLVQRVARLRTKSDSLDQGFLGVVIGSAAFTNYVIGVQTGSAVPHISGGQIGDFEFTLPPIREQRAIAATLGALDDKIESNRRLIELIPSLVRARVDVAIADESVTIPVSDLATFTNGGAYTKGATGTGRMVIRIAELNSGPGGSTVYNDIEVPDNKTARAGDILMAWSGSLGVYRWYRDEAIINQHIFKVDPDGYPAWLVFDRLEAVMPVFRALAADKATTMGHIQRGHLTSTTASLPTTAAIARLDEEIAPLWERLLLAERENQRLSRLRDALLPELLSGRLRTPAEAS